MKIMVPVTAMNTLFDKILEVLQTVEGMDIPEAMLALGVALKAYFRKLEGGENYDEATLLAHLMENAGSILTSIENQTDDLVAKVGGDVETSKEDLN